ncbi:MAG: ABC transporter ATP-binding protein, partial [Chloroflexi bacterium]|nr:ABC transporter ATP-binding protein [Chloroflexota bacterium]
MTRNAVAALEKVSKRLGDSQALNSFDLSIGEGELLALLGPNGAGKTTALNILLGLRRPDSGAVSLFGLDPRNRRARRFIGVTPQNIGMPGQLRVLEVVELIRAHYSNPLSASELFEKFDLAGVASRQIGGLSSGQLRRLAVALAFVGRPRAMFLDEPTTGLDVEARR